MLEQKAKELLEAAYARAFADPIYDATQETYRRLKLRCRTLVKSAGPEIASAARERLSAADAAIVEEGENYLVVILGAGVRAMNPAVVELCFTEGQAHMTAWAKEGFIPQRTAQKALRACAGALGLK